MKKTFCSWAITLLVAFSGFAQASIARHRDSALSISYGEGNHILYNKLTGRYNVYAKGAAILSDVNCSFELNGNTHFAAAGLARMYRQRKITDRFGEGTETVITRETGKVKAEQIFYTYANQNFFLTQVRLIGKHLSSNRMTPLDGHLPQHKGNWRSLFVPFDNDTFISYDARPLVVPFNNESSEVTVIYNDASRVGLIAGSVEHETWKTGVQTSWAKKGLPNLTVLAGYTDAAVTRDHITHGLVKGDTICSPRIFTGYFDDWRTGMETFGRANRIADPPFIYNWTKPTPVGWNSWGVMQDHLTFDKAVAVTHFFADSLSNFRTGGTAFIDLDSFWDRMVKNGIDYSQLKAFADSCLAKGLQPGVYWAPFTDWGWKSGPSRKVEGSNYTYGELWTKTGADNYHEIDGARAIDPTHPGTLRRIDYFIDRLKACGFKMIKIDFLGHATAESTHFYDTTVTTGMQAYRKGMEYLVHRLGNQMFVYAAISPSLATGRYVHSRRIACDAFKTIDHTRYTLNSVTYGWWQTFLYNYVDADHVVLASESEGTNRARFLSAIITGTCFTGDDFSVHGPWSERARELYQNKAILQVIKNGKAFRPVESAAGKSAAEVFIRKIGSDYYLAVFNYGNSLKNYAIDFKRLNIESNTASCTDLLSQHVSNSRGLISIALPATDATLIKITPKQN